MKLLAIRSGPRQPESMAASGTEHLQSNKPEQIAM